VLTLTKTLTAARSRTVYDVVTLHHRAGDGDHRLQPVCGNKWWYVQMPKWRSYCWVSDANVQVTAGQTDCMPVIPAPPTPTPRPPTRTPTITPTLPPSDTTPPPTPSRLSPSDGFLSIGGCPSGVTLTWLQVNDASGIARYEWEMERYNPLSEVMNIMRMAQQAEERQMSRWVVAGIAGACERWMVQAIQVVFHPGR
jgi:hypothetical protein